jgi:acetyl esterase/lipase
MPPPAASRAAAISPIAQLRQGNYCTPTFIVHSRCDEVVPFGSAEEFIGEMKRRGVECGFLALDGMSHLHDLNLRPGMREWDEGVEPGYAFLDDRVI